MQSLCWWVSNAIIQTNSMLHMTLLSLLLHQTYSELEITVLWLYIRNVTKIEYICRNDVSEVTVDVSIWINFNGDSGECECVYDQETCCLKITPSTWWNEDSSSKTILSTFHMSFECVPLWSSLRETFDRFFSIIQCCNKVSCSMIHNSGTLSAQRIRVSNYWRKIGFILTEGK